ncbi:MAG: hypothetical protein P9D89_03655 [Candidatus Contendobacter sp.]|nr:hypothetical protein [Candidatus Contendobacter sp.]
MTEYAVSLARKIGRLDALIFFVIWSCVGLASAAHPWGSLPIIVFLLVPASALVGWRGAASVRLILAGTASLRRAAIEGFCWGAAFVFAVWLWGVSKSALAAGGVLDDLSPLQAEFWLALSVTLLPALGIGGTLGALHGIALFYLNRWLVRANPPLNTDAPPNGGAPVS